MRALKTLVLAAALIMAAIPVFSEAVFLKTGEIIEGKIISENDAGLKLRVDGEVREIARLDVLRILYNENYKELQYIYTEDDREIIGYIVSENETSIIVREDLSSGVEITIDKSDLVGILRRPLKEAGLPVEEVAP